MSSPPVAAPNEVERVAILLGYHSTAHFVIAAGLRAGVPPVPVGHNELAVMLALVGVVYGHNAGFAGIIVVQLRAE